MQSFTLALSQKKKKKKKGTPRKNPIGRDPIDPPEKTSIPPTKSLGGKKLSNPHKVKCLGGKKLSNPPKVKCLGGKKLQSPRQRVWVGKNFPIPPKSNVWVGKNSNPPQSQMFGREKKKIPIPPKSNVWEGQKLSNLVPQKTYEGQNLLENAPNKKWTYFLLPSFFWSLVSISFQAQCSEKIWKENWIFIIFCVLGKTLKVTNLFVAGKIFKKLTRPIS